MDKVELVKQSLLKNIGELSEFLVELNINNYYELIDKITNNHNFKVMTKMKNKKLWEEINKELESE